jgi:hypothetical protein
VARFTAYHTDISTLVLGVPDCETNTAIYPRPTDNLWITIGKGDENWLTTTLGVCNPCPSGTDKEIGTRLGVMPKRIYESIGGLGSCTTATMDDEPVTKVALVPVTITTTEYV